MTHFVSIDAVTQEDTGESGGNQCSKLSRRKQQKCIEIPQHIQQQLWSQPACANTKLIPGRLALCVGIPVMICTNSATELPITKGQEAVAHSWNYTTNTEGENVLETLFVCLVNPPTNVHLDGLPPHVVPLTKTCVTTSVRLPDDTQLTISWNQVEILPNFAMTDYTSQGKTWHWNVVELGHSESHQAYYTALSRGTTAAGTLILSGFHPHRIQGGASGTLSQEFHELELLDTITTLQFNGELEPEIMVEERCKPLIAAFQKRRGATFMPKNMHKALHWGPTDPYLEWTHSELDWQLVSH